MKKTFMLLISVLFICTALGQSKADGYAKLLAHDITEESNGFILSNEITESSTGDLWARYRLRFPSYYDFGLVRMAVRKVVRDYSDINVYTPWTMDEDGDYYTMLSMPEGYYATLWYFPNSEVLSIGIKLRESEKNTIKL